MVRHDCARARFAGLLAVFGMVVLPLAAKAQDSGQQPAKFAKSIQFLEKFIAEEMAANDIPGLSIALVDGQKVVWSKGFGVADPATKTPATTATVYRVGAISSVFTDLAVLKLVEGGVLDLDAPVSRYLPNFKPINPFGKAITLRHLMTHRSGLVREPPVGNYFDPTSRTIAQTVQSLNGTQLVYAPGSRTKYSNAGVTVAGQVVENTQGEAFAKYVKRVILEPMGLQSTSFEVTPALSRNLAKGTMWSYHGTTFEPPTFRLGIEPAVGLYSTVDDLSKFVRVLFSDARGPGGSILKRELFEQLMKPRLEIDDLPSFGIGFQWHSSLTARLTGSTYGFASELAIMPDKKRGVVVLANRDSVDGVCRRIVYLALLLMRGLESPPPTIDRPTIASERSIAHLAGRYRSGYGGVELFSRGSTLYAWLPKSGVRTEFRPNPDSGERLTLNSYAPSTEETATSFFQVMTVLDNALALELRTYRRIPDVKPQPAPNRWSGLIGEYGWDHSVLYILEKDGKLHALIGWFFLYPLEEITEDIFRFPSWGLYQDEQVSFVRDVRGRATEVRAGGVTFKRRHIDGEDGTTFRIKPLRPVEELRREALAAKPQVEAGYLLKPDLVDVTKLDPTIKIDIRYASSNNFLSAPLYTSARAFLQRPAAEAVARVHKKLAAQGYGLLLHDCYRPWYVTKMFWEATPGKDRIFVADPSKGSRHNRGCAADLTLYDLKTGKPIKMVGGYDEFSDRSYPDYLGGTSLERWHRELLRRSMEAEGFTVYEAEWWHFDYKDWKKYPILNLTFQQLEK